ncbi:MAG TPA: hypothetical protein VF796_05145 [Humisphaera sp.]
MSTTTETPSRPAPLPEIPAADPVPANDGRHPPLALPVMAVGVAAAAAAGAALAGVFIGLLMVAYGCFAAGFPTLARLVDATGVVGNVVIFLALAVFSFFGVAMGAGVTLPWFVRVARNRSSLATFAYGVAAGLLAATVVKTFIVLSLEPGAPSIRQVGVWAGVRFAFGINAWDKVLTALWAAAGSLTAGLVAFGASADAPFCDGCNRFMTEAVRRKVSPSAIRRVAAAAKARDYAGVASALAGDASGKAATPDGDGGSPNDGRGKAMPADDRDGGSVVVHRCGECGRGHVEATWYRPDGDGRRLVTVASARLGPAEAESTLPRETDGATMRRRTSK